MALSATLLFYGQLTKSGAGVTGKSGSITATIKKLTRGSTPTITTVSTGGAITVGSVAEIDASLAKGVYVVGVSGLDPAADYLAGLHYTGTASDVDLVDVPALQSEFSASINAGAVPQVAFGAAGGVGDTQRFGGTTVTGRDIGASVLLSAGTGTGQLDFTSGVLKSNVIQLLGTAWLTPGTAGTPDVNVKLFGGVAGTFAGGRPEVNTTLFGGHALSINASNALKVSVAYWQDTAVAVDATTSLPIFDLHAINGSSGAAGFLQNLATDYDDGGLAASVSSVTGSVGGKVLGAGTDVITATGVWALDGSGNAVATAASLATAQTAINNINNLSALANLFGPLQLEVPASGSIAYPYTLVAKDAEGHLVDLSGTPTVTAANAAGTDRSANLSAVTHAGTGQYAFTYTVSSGAAQEGLTIKATGTAASDSTTRLAYINPSVVSIDTGAAIAAIKAKTDLLATNSADSPNAVTAQTTINGLATSGGGGGVVGPGANHVTLNFKDAGVPIANAAVWISTDAAGTNVIAGTLQTNSNGDVTFLLDAGLTYYVNMQKDGLNPIVGQAFVAVAD